MNTFEPPVLAKPMGLHAALLRQVTSAMRHLLIIVADEKAVRATPGHRELHEVLARRGKGFDALAKGPVAVSLPGGALASFVCLAGALDEFTRQTRLREACAVLLAETPRRIDIAAYGSAAFRREALRLASYVVWLNGVALPDQKREKKPALRQLALHGVADGDDPARDLIRQRVLAEANSLTRALTVLPPNRLTPGIYRHQVAALARREGWTLQSYGLARLKKMGAGAFVAVAQGSDPADAAIVRLDYVGPGTRSRSAEGIALVGKGICFDTGGHNLKPARYMHGMHEDMNGSAVALGVLLAASRLKLPLRLTVWLALAENHLSPAAYKQSDVVTALDGTSIEIVHTDAEGRMVLADTLTLASRAKPGLILDFATLTGSMYTALGARYSGVLSNRDALLDLALAAGRKSGERVCAFPLAEDYATALESDCADIKQCILEGEADHILAALFLKRFVKDVPWLHMDLSASRCKGGLGAVASEVTGFGVGWALAFLEQWVDRRAGKGGPLG